MPMDNAKLFALIQVSDLEQHPVWETILDDEAKDPSEFPVRQLPVTNLDSRFVATRVRLASEKLVWAMLFNVDLADSRKTEHLVQLRIAHNGEWFWLARYWDIVSVTRTPSCKDLRRNAMLRHDQALKEGMDEVAKAGFRAGT